MRHLTLIVALLVSTIAFAATPLEQAWAPYRNRIQAIADAIPDHPTQAQIDAAKAEAKAIGEEFNAQWKGQELAVEGYCKTSGFKTWGVRTINKALDKTSPRELAWYTEIMSRMAAAVGKQKGATQMKAQAVVYPASRRPEYVSAIARGLTAKAPVSEGHHTTMTGVLTLADVELFAVKDNASDATGEIRAMRGVAAYPTIRLTLETEAASLAQKP